MFVPDLRCLPRRQSIPPAHPVRAGRSHSQDGTRCTAACGWDARAPRTALDAPLPAGGTPAHSGRHSMHRCLRAGRPRTQGRTVYVTRARRSHSQDGTRCTAACGRDARAPRVAPSTSRGRDARAPRTASCQSEFGITLSRDRALRSLLPVRARARTTIPAHTHTTSSGGGATAPRFRFPRR